MKTNLPFRGDSLVQSIREGQKMTWFKQVFDHEKAIIASMYLPPLPGSPDFKPSTSLDDIIEYTRNELANLQEGGMDGVSIGNQRDCLIRLAWVQKHLRS